MLEVLRTAYFVVSVDDKVAVIVRTSEPFPTVDESTKAWLGVSAALDRAGRSGRSLLTDLRRGPARNDPAFEQAVLTLVPRIHRGFSRNAVLVRLAAGALQIRRHAREDGIERLVTDSEEAAYAYFNEPAPSSVTRR